MRLLWSLGALWALAGCAFNNTGQIDYRVATTDPAAATPANCSSKGKCVALDRRYSLSDYRYDQPFSADDVYSISIEQMVIGDDISESHYFKKFDDSGEFAVLANVFEFASTAADAQQRSFLQGNELSDEASTDQRLKLVYYDDGIEALQPLNFSNIPLVPRSQYHGGSIGIQIVVMELDTKEGPMTSLLTTLARVGQKAVPVSPAVTDVILDLGESLFQGGTYDDRLFEYRFVLANGEEAQGNSQGTFAPGRYVLRRQDERGTEIDWDNARLDVETGRLRGADGKEIRNQLYMVLNVAKYDPATAVEYYDYDAWSDFRQALAESDPVATTLSELQGKLDTKLAEQRSDDWLRKLQLAWVTAEARLNRYARAEFTDIDTAFANCPAPDTTTAKRMRDEAEQAATDALRAFETAYQQASARAGEFKDPERAALISRVARFFMPWSDATQQAHFADAASFDAYLANGLRDRALAVAKSRGTPGTCAKPVAAVPPVSAPALS